MGPYHFPEFDPVALQLGPVAIRWYALAYIFGLILAWRYCVRLTRQFPMGVTAADFDDFLVWATLGVVIGGRIGFVIIVDPAYFLAHPLEIPQMWKGGMSFHGGCVGVIVAALIFAHVRKISVFSLGDCVAAATPIGLFLGRIANFINGELWGRVTDVPWAFIFPRAGPDPRHPSQLYEAFTEGIVLFSVLAWLIYKRDALRWPGLVAGSFLIGYAFARGVVEFVREEGVFIGMLPWGFTFGHLLSIPMILFGGWLIWRARRKGPVEPVEAPEPAKPAD